MYTSCFGTGKRVVFIDLAITRCRFMITLINFAMCFKFCARSESSPGSDGSGGIDDIHLGIVELACLSKQRNIPGEI